VTLRIRHRQLLAKRRCHAAPCLGRGHTRISTRAEIEALVKLIRALPRCLSDLRMANCQIHPKSGDSRGVDMIPEMRDCLILFVHLLVTVARLAGPGGLRSVVAESVLVRHQLLILNRGRKRAPNLRTADRIVAGLCTLFIRPGRVLRSALVLKPSTLLHFHSVLSKRKVPRLVFSQTPPSAGPEGTGPRPHRCRGCHETA